MTEIICERCGVGGFVITGYFLDNRTIKLCRACALETGVIKKRKTLLRLPFRKRKDDFDCEGFYRSQVNKVKMQNDKVCPICFKLKEDDTKTCWDCWDNIAHKKLRRGDVLKCDNCFRHGLSECHNGDDPSPLYYCNHCNNTGPVTDEVYRIIINNSKIDTRRETRSCSLCSWISELELDGTSKEVQNYSKTIDDPLWLCGLCGNDYRLKFYPLKS